MSETEIERLKRRIATLEARERRHLAILESSVDFAIITMDRDGLVTEWNRGAEHILGWPTEAMIGQSAERFFTPEDRATDRMGLEMARALRDGRAADNRWHLRADGGRFWAAGEMMPLRDTDGVHLGYLKMLRDLTGEHAAAEALRHAESGLRRAQAAGGVGVFSVGMDGILHTSPEFCRLYGMPEQEQFPATDYEALVIPGDAALVSTAASRIAGNAPLDVEYRIRRRDTGELRWIARKGEIERDETGRSIRFVGVARDITDQVEAQAALAAEREQLAQMFEQAPTFMALLRGPDHRIERANPGYIALIDGRDAVGKTVAEALPDAVEQGFVDLLDEVYRTGKPHFANASRYRVQAAPHADIHERYVDFVFQPILDAAGTVSGIFIQGADVTERTVTGAALRESEERYRSLLATIDVGFCVIEMKFDADGVPVDYLLVEGNAAFERQTGLVDPYGKWVSEIAPGLERHWFDLYGAVAMTGEPAHFENPADIFGRWYDVRAIRASEPERRVAVFFNDISDRKRMEEELRVLNTMLEGQVEQRTRERDQLWRLSRDPFLIADATGTWLNVSQAWTDLLGWSEAELIGRTSEWMEHPDDHAKTRAEVEHLAAGESTIRFENRFRTKDGRYRWFSWTATPADGRMFCVARDVTAEKEQAEALARAEDQLRQSQKMEAVGQLTGGLAHDFNNLLTGISGSLEMLGIRVAQGRYADVDRYVNAAQGASKRAAALTHRLLAFSRRQTLDPKPTDANRLIAAMEELVRRTVGPAVMVEVVASSGLWPVLVDPNQLDNALLNLCINARDAMPDGGRLTIETANRWIDARAAREQDIEPGQYVSICVSDTGTGMTPDVIAKAFDPFFTTKPMGEGTGLGLSMIYGFARQSGGQVRIYSEVGQGAMLCLYLPRYFGDAETADAEPEFAEAPRAAAGETVLVVDDEPTVRMLVVEVLEELGYAPLEAGDGAAGLKILQSDIRIDLLVTDVGLPGGMNGRQMADAARLHRPDLKILFITGYAENAVVGNGHLLPGMHVMTKPFGMEALATRIKTLIVDG